MPSGKPHQALASLHLKQVSPSLTAQVDWKHETRANCQRLSIKYFSVHCRCKDMYVLNSVVKYRATIVQIVIDLKSKSFSNVLKTFKITIHN
jgi:hypothetical protein